MNFENLHNLHAGETALVIGNGPSLNDIPAAFLGKYPSFGTNRIYMLSGFTPSYYVAINPLVIEQSTPEIAAMDCTKFIRASHADRIPGAYDLVSVGAPMFSYNPAVYIYEGFTVTFVCLQLAFFMGFETVLLVGIDHRYKSDGPPNSETVWQGDDPNHFTPDYFRDAKWNNPDLSRSAEAYQLARTAFDNVGRRIINLTPNTALDVFEKGELSKW